MTDGELLSEERIRRIFPGMVTALRRFLVACATGDEETVARLLVEDQFQVSVAGTRVEASLHVMGFSAADCAEADRILEAGRDVSLAIYSNAEGGEFTISAGVRRARLGIRLEASRWRIQIMRPPGRLDRLLRGPRGGRRQVTDIAVPRDE